MKTLLFVGILTIFTALIGVPHNINIDRDSAEMRFSYDRFQFPISSYENRLIVSNIAKTEELLIHPNGELESIGFFDYSYEYSIVNQNQYILPKYSPIFSHTPVSNGIYIFDLSVTPMEYITYVNLRNVMGNIKIDRNNLFVSDSHIMVHHHPSNRIHLICRTTLELDGFVMGFGFGFYEIYNNHLYHLSSTGTELLLNIYSIENFRDFTQISSSSIDGHGGNFGEIKIKDDKLGMVTGSGFLMIDISDVVTPILSNHIVHPIYAFDFSSSYVFAYDVRQENEYITYNVVVFSQNHLGIYEQVFSYFIGSPFVSRDIVHYKSPYLFVNGELATFVFDTENDFEIVYRYGHRVWIPCISVSNDDVYFMRDDFFEKTQTIYSVIDNELIVTMNYENMIMPAYTCDFEILGNMIYVTTTIDGWVCFDVNLIEDQQSHLLHRVPINDSTGGSTITIVNYKAFITTYNPRQTYVFDISNDEPVFISNFGGSIQQHHAGVSNNFVLNLNGGFLNIRDIDNLDNILFQRFHSSFQDGFVSYYDEQNFTQAKDVTCRFFSFCIENSSLNQLRTFQNRFILPYNQIITTYSTTMDVNIAEYWTIDGSQVRSLGSFDYGNRRIHTSLTYFFPDRNKKVLIAMGGIWVYDIEVEVSETDNTLLVTQSYLSYSYPNPFNPETTIKFYLQSDSFVNIDIFNIKGQKIKTLVNEFSPSGDHQAAWNGTDDKGQNVSSGVYFYRITTDNYTSTKKMVLMK
jgi:hypothetical protein